MKKIIWQSKAGAVFDSFRVGKILPGANGGNAYDVQAALLLRKYYDIDVDDTALRGRESVLSYWLRMRNHRPHCDVVIMEPFPLVYGPSGWKTSRVAVIHHIDSKAANGGLYHRWYFGRLMRRLSYMDAVVTVSAHWRDFLRKAGCRRVEVIYNSFDLSEFELSNDESFRSRMNLPPDKPIIHIGNASREKGVYEVYDSLKNSDYHLVMTGARNRAPDLPVQYLCPGRADFLRLLAACSVVVAYSHLEEGWNRIVHESMLCRTPVIGNGKGGMAELLRNGIQIQVASPSEIPSAVLEAIRNREAYSNNGFNYARRFDLEYFSSRWHEVIESLTGG
jgi:glycosyltransferase involved in cell wall biosynthesis